MYQTILFDMDGTLSPSLPHWLQAFHRAFAELGQIHTDEVVIKRCFYRDPKEFTCEFGVDEQQFHRHLQDHLKEAFEQRSLFEGVREMLELCLSLDIRLGLVTSAGRHTVEQLMVPLGIFQHFQTIVAAGDAPHFKPHPAPVLLAVEKLCARKQSTIFIGDGPVDICAGKAAGVDTALFCPADNAPFHDHEELMATAPHFVFDNYATLCGYLTGGWPPKPQVETSPSTVC